MQINKIKTNLLHLQGEESAREDTPAVTPGRQTGFKTSRGKDCSRSRQGLDDALQKLEAGKRSWGGGGGGLGPRPGPSGSEPAWLRH